MADPSFSGKVAVITGGTKGIGAATATAFVKAGAKVVVNYGRDASAADKLVSTLGKDKAIAVQADAGSVAGVETLVQAAVEAFGKIDILVPNAGVLPMKTLEATSEADFDRTFALNVKGPYFLVQKAVPHMARGGKVVFISTGQNFNSAVTPPYLLYCATKGAIDQITRIMAKDLAAKGIRVNAVAPGPTGTDLFYEGKSEELLNMLRKASPFGKFGEPEEIADAILFMASDQSRWVAGQILRANGAGVV